MKKRRSKKAAVHAARAKRTGGFRRRGNLFSGSLARSGQLSPMQEKRIAETAARARLVGAPAMVLEHCTA